MSLLNNMLENNFIPYACDYSIQKQDNIDYNKINYCDFHSFEFYSKRFKYYESLPGLEKHIWDIVEKNKNKYPIDELDIKINNLNIINE